MAMLALTDKHHSMCPTLTILLHRAIIEYKICVFAVLAGGTDLTYFSIQPRAACEECNSSVETGCRRRNRRPALVNLSLKKRDELHSKQCVLASSHPCCQLEMSQLTIFEADTLVFLSSSRINAGSISIRSRTIPAKSKRSSTIFEMIFADADMRSKA